MTNNSSASKGRKTQARIKRDEGIVRLGTYLRDHVRDVTTPLEALIWSAELAISSWSVRWLARDVLSTALLKAQQRAAQFDSNNNPDLWILAITSKVLDDMLKDMRKVQRALPLLRRPSSANLPPAGTLAAQNRILDDEAFDYLLYLASALTSNSPQLTSHVRQEFKRLLAKLKDKGDREILRCAILQHLDGEKIGTDLGILPAEARLKLFRALDRLRAVW